MNEFNYDWTQFTREIFVQADLPTVFQAWAKPGEITKWFIATANVTTVDNQLRSPDDIMQVGDQYHWRWHQDLQTSGTILDVVENERLQFTFGDRTPGSDEKVIVTVTFKALDDTTSIVLKQENLPDDERSHVHWHMGCNMGWSFFMTNLKALLEHGVDLRELDSDRAYASRAITH
jgi:uncharacterized protein YndB with AHSA1/START domain